MDVDWCISSHSGKIGLKEMSLPFWRRYFTSTHFEVKRIKYLSNKCILRHNHLNLLNIVSKRPMQSRKAKALIIPIGEFIEAAQNKVVISFCNFRDLFWEAKRKHPTCGLDSRWLPLTKQNPAVIDTHFPPRTSRIVRTNMKNRGLLVIAGAILLAVVDAQLLDCLKNC